MSRPDPSSPPASATISLPAAVSIGVGGMIGAGVFSIMGVVAGVSGSALPLSFAIGGVVALLAAYSYVKLGVRYPSVGGAVQFLVRGYGDGIVSGGINIFQYLAFVIAIALYANGFAAYAATFFPGDVSDAELKALGVGIVVLFTAINFLGTRVMGRAETWIVGIKLTILLVFIVSGFFFIDPDSLEPSGWAGASDILFGAGVLFIGYEGFGLITNAAGEMRDPKRDLPRAVYAAVFIVIAVYLLVAIAVIGNLSLSEIAAAQDSALAEAAKPALGEFGFKLIAIAAILSTSSAVNATLFGAANVSYQVAKDGELPESFSRKIWDRNVEGLFITSGLVILFVILFDLGPIAMMGSAAFLLVYAAVNAGHLRIHGETGARPEIIWLSLLTCLAMFVLLMVYIVKEQPAGTWIALVVTLAVSFTLEYAYRKRTGRTMDLLLREPDDQAGGTSE